VGEAFPEPLPPPKEIGLTVMISATLHKGRLVVPLHAAAADVLTGSG